MPSMSYAMRALIGPELLAQIESHRTANPRKVLHAIFVSLTNGMDKEWREAAAQAARQPSKEPKP
jgi:hypothetical protein